MDPVRSHYLIKLCHLWRFSHSSSVGSRSRISIILSLCSCRVYYSLQRWQSMEYRDRKTVYGVNYTTFHLSVTTGMPISSQTLQVPRFSSAVLLCKGISLPNLPGDRCLPFSFLYFFFVMFHFSLMLILSPAPLREVRFKLLNCIAVN